MTIKWYDIALAIVLALFVIVIMVVFVAGCSSTDAGVPRAEREPPLKNLLIVDTPAQSEMLNIGCSDNVCAYTFSYGGRRCFVVIGQANQMNADSWMMDLECPG